jgi:biuret amidohydrolase
VLEGAAAHGGTTKTPINQSREPVTLPKQLTAQSAPYPWPWHGAFNPERSAILVFSDGAFTPPARDLIDRLSSIVTFGKRLGMTIGELGDGAPGPAWTGVRPDFAIRTPHYGGFTGTDLDFVLRSRRLTDLILAGFPFELGADCTMRQANDLGYECVAISDCCSGFAADTLAGAMSSIQMSGGIFGAVATTTAVLELFRSALSAKSLYSGGA